MELPRESAETSNSVQAVLGYLNFSAGTHDPQFLSQLNALYRELAAAAQPESEDAVLSDAVIRLLLVQLAHLNGVADAFRDTTQAQEVLEGTRDQVLPAYRNFHRDLLFHQTDDMLFGPFFLGRVFECVLAARQQSGLDAKDLVDRVIDSLNDYVGYRPVATLETERKIEPYPHERSRPIPLYIRGVGTAYGRYEELIARTLEILRATEAGLLARAQFDLDRMEELALDPRPYDFDHPVNKRPNFQFGSWDPHRVDNKGFYSRFVLQQVTVESLFSRFQESDETSQEQQVFEAAAALAGTILMASAVGGSGPDAYSSDVTLNTLLPVIAGYRDEFYESLLRNIANKDGAENQRLLDEAARLHQPFGGVRQHLNAELARRRASQMEHVHLARLFARMGYPEAAARQAAFVPAASARIVCMIECLLTDTDSELDAGGIDTAAGNLSKCVELLHRGIECGAIVDPWNILGFDANFSLFPAPENSVHDHRIDELIELMDSIFALFARTLCLSAAADRQELCESVSQEFGRFADWWDQFAVTAVSSVDGMAAGPLHQAATAAAEALAAWQSAGVTSGDIRFWQPFAERFQSPKAYVLVIDALLDQGDFVASMSLLMHWLNQSEQVDLQEGSDLFHVVATRWLDDVVASLTDASSDVSMERWQLVAKFFDFLEANAGTYWEVPTLQLDSLVDTPANESEEPEEEEEEDELYSAAYDGMIYRDSTDDGIDSELLGDHLPETDYELEFEARRISDRLAFLVTVVRLWKSTVLAVTRAGSESQAAQPPRERFTQWLHQLLRHRAQILDLMNRVARIAIPPPTPTPDSVVEYDRHRIIQEALIDRIIASQLAHTETAQFLIAAGAELPPDFEDEQLTVISATIRAALAGDINDLRQQIDRFTECLGKHNLLYVPLTKGGDPLAITNARCWQRGLRFLLSVLPRLGMIKETHALMATSADHERDQPVGPGAVTEFDQIFRIGNQGMVECIVASAESWTSKEPGSLERTDEEVDHELIEYLQQLIETMMQQWLDHSQTLRLSVLEKVNSTKKWKRLMEFVQKHGHDLFDQNFLNLGNLRGILHRGVSTWLDDTATAADEEEMTVLTALKDKAAKREVVEQLQIIIEAIIENYVEYRDYNGTTTQSDRGEFLYTLIDMLRLRTGYDRVTWNLIPIAQAHEVLVRRRRTAAAEAWRTEMVHRTGETADEMLARLRKLQTKYGMRLSTVADRIGERFLRPLEIDRVKVLVEPAIKTVRRRDQSIIRELEQLIDDLTRDPTGVGLDLPYWLEILEDEVESVRGHRLQRDTHEEIIRHFPQQTLTRARLQEQLDAM